MNELIRMMRKLESSMWKWRIFAARFICALLVGVSVCVVCSHVTICIPKNTLIMWVSYRNETIVYCVSCPHHFAHTQHPHESHALSSGSWVALQIALNRARCSLAQLAHSAAMIPEKLNLENVCPWEWATAASGRAERRSRERRRAEESGECTSRNEWHQFVYPTVHTFALVIVRWKLGTHPTSTNLPAENGIPCCPSGLPLITFHYIRKWHNLFKTGPWLATAISTLCTTHEPTHMLLARVRAGIVLINLRWWQQIERCDEKTRNFFKLYWLNLGLSWKLLLRKIFTENCLTKHCRLIECVYTLA